jgi:hypothetical protein
MPSTSQPPEFEIGFKLTAWVRAESIDEALRWLLRDLEPKLEARLGFEGMRAVTFSNEHARGPDNTGR